MSAKKRVSVFLATCVLSCWLVATATGCDCPLGMECNDVQETGRVVKHIEMWDVEPAKVLKRLIRPASRTPTSRWETFMLSVHEGDLKGIWLAASAPLLTVSAPVVGMSLFTKLATGHGLPVSKQHNLLGLGRLLYISFLPGYQHPFCMQGTFLGGVEGLAWLVLVAGTLTQAQQLFKNIGGA